MDILINRQEELFNSVRRIEKELQEYDVSKSKYKVQTIFVCAW